MVRRKETAREMIARLMQRVPAHTLAPAPEDATPAADGAAGALQQMCRCLQQPARLPGGSRVAGILRAWYVPRHDEDIDCYVTRCRLCRTLPSVVRALRQKRKENV